MIPRIWMAAASAATALALAACAPNAMTIGVTGVATEFVPGPGAGFGAGSYPEIVEGGPMGAGVQMGSLDVLSLGVGGTLTLAFPGFMLCDGEGPDLIVFENAFWVGGNPDMAFAEPAFVGVSDLADGEWVEWPCAAEEAPWTDCAGVAPVLASENNDIDPTDWELAGGDAFDLADLGLREAAFVRIRDAALADPGVPGDNLGADIDAIVAVHACPISPP